MIAGPIDIKSARLPAKVVVFDSLEAYIPRVGKAEIDVTGQRHLEEQMEDQLDKLKFTIDRYEDAMKWAPRIHRMQGFVVGMAVATLLWYFLP